MTNVVLEELVAKQAISEIIYRYCRGLDRMDRPLALSCWHTDGTADYGELFRGTGEGFIDWVWPRHEALLGHSHQITNILIEVDGERAASESYVTVALRSERDAGTLTDRVTRGRYLDRWSRRAGVWAIDHRIYVHELVHTHEVRASHAGPGNGRRDRDDPSYALLNR